jgi:hypothetical protein
VVSSEVIVGSGGELALFFLPIPSTVAIVVDSQ